MLQIIFRIFKLSNFFYIDLFNGETTPGSLNAVFKSPMENYPTDNNTPSTTRRFIITPVTLKNTSNIKE